MEMKKETNKKSNAGRKPVEDKKVTVYLFIKQSVLDFHGGKEAVQKKCYDLLENKF